MRKILEFKGHPELLIHLLKNCSILGIREAKEPGKRATAKNA
ncbi:MAG TPA: hypothetical protein VF343_04145 [Syntrophales bacterium]